MKKTEAQGLLILNEEAIGKLKACPEGLKIVKRANSVARKGGASIATTITIGLCDRLIDHTKLGYIYRGTGRYVGSGCRGFRDVYHQRALAHVELEGCESGFACSVLRLLHNR